MERLESPRPEVRKMGTQRQKAVGTKRLLTATESKDMVMMEKILFEDDRKTNDFLKTLINANGIQTAWDDLQKRVMSCEDLCVDVLRKTSASALREEFVSREEYVEKVEGEHSSELENHRERLKLQEASTEKQQELNEDYTRRLHDHHERLLVQEQAVDNTKDELARLEAQDLERHEALLAIHAAAVEQQTKRSDKLHDELSSLEVRVTSEEKLRAALAEEVAVQKDFLSGDTFTEHVQKVCREILVEYTRKDELHEEAKAAVQVILKPVMLDAQRLKTEITNTNSRNDERFEGIESSLKRAHNRINEDHKDFTLRMDDITTRVDLCSTKKIVDAKEAALQTQINTDRAYMTEIKKVTGLKFEELVNRLLEFQSIAEDHEHALQHQAEELLNRTTKYDLMLCERRIDDCALREKVDGDIKEVKNMAQWLSTKLEKMGVHQSFRGRRRAVTHERIAVEATDGEAAAANDGQAAEDRSRVASQASTHGDTASSCGMFGDIRVEGCMNPTELLSLLRDQLGRVSQGLLGLSHMVFHSVSQPVSTREERQLREAELIHHLSCIVDWVAHKRAPSDWDQAKFTSLVMSAAVPADYDRRRSPLSSVKRSHGASQSTAASQHSASMSSSMALAGSLSSPSRSPRQPTRRASGERRMGELVKAIFRKEEHLEKEVSTDLQWLQTMPGEEGEEVEEQGDALSAVDTSSQASRLEAITALSEPRRPPASSSGAFSAREARVEVPVATTIPRLEQPGLPGTVKQPPRSGGGFRGRLLKTRPAATRGVREADAAESAPATQVELGKGLPRIVGRLEDVDEGPTPSITSST